MYVFNVTFISGKTFFLDFSCVKGTEIILLLSYFAFVISVNLIVNWLRLAKTTETQRVILNLLQVFDVTVDFLFSSLTFFSCIGMRWYRGLTGSPAPQDGM